MLHRNIKLHGIMIAYHLLLPSDAADLTSHLCRLPAEQRRLRFFTSVNDAFIAAHVRDIDWRHAVVIGALRSGHIVAAAELFATGDDAELAVTVDRDLQGEGIGTELVRRALLAARNRGIGHVRIEYLSHNIPIDRIARKFAPELHLTRFAATADIAVPARDPASLWREIAAEAAGWFWDFLDRFRPAFRRR